MCSGPSQAEKNAAAQSAAFSQQLQKQFTQEFAQQQEISKFLVSQLNPMITNPTGFTPQQLSILNSNLINNVGSQVASARQQIQQRAATSNEAGLPSGVTAMNEALVTGAGISAEATGLNENQLASAELAQQKQQMALQEEAQLSGQAGAVAGSFANSANTANQTAFNQANVINQQQNSLWQNILGGVLGAGTSFLTGGLSNIVGGMGFFGGARPATASPSGGGGGGIPSF